jgi:hypothetical protein
MADYPSKSIETLDFSREFEERIEVTAISLPSDLYRQIVNDFQRNQGKNYSPDNFETAFKDYICGFLYLLFRTFNEEDRQNTLNEKRTHKELCTEYDPDIIKTDVHSDVYYNHTPETLYQDVSQTLTNILSENDLQNCKDYLIRNVLRVPATSLSGPIIRNYSEEMDIFFPLYLSCRKKGYTHWDLM